MGRGADLLNSDLLKWVLHKSGAACIYSGPPCWCWYHNTNQICPALPSSAIGCNCYHYKAYVRMDGS